MPDRDYILGTNDEEIERLGIQHRVWRRRALDAWIDAGFTTGQTIVDVGCGPGYASMDLAEIAGVSGRVVAIDRSTRFLDSLRARHIHNIEACEADLDDDALPQVNADGAWVRWVFAFVKRPNDLLRKVRTMLRPGAPLVIHEYFNYATWQLTPHSDAFDAFVAAVIKSWRANGGEPNIALDLTRWLPPAGFEIRRLRPIMNVISPSSFVWQWPDTFLRSGVERLVSLGYFSPQSAEELKRAIDAAAGDPLTLMITPAVLEIVAAAK